MKSKQKQPLYLIYIFGDYYNRKIIAESWIRIFEHGYSTQQRYKQSVSDRIVKLAEIRNHYGNAILLLKREFGCKNQQFLPILKLNSVFSNPQPVEKLHLCYISIIV